MLINTQKFLSALPWLIAKFLSTQTHTRMVRCTPLSSGVLVPQLFASPWGDVGALRAPYPLIHPLVRTHATSPPCSAAPHQCQRAGCTQAAHTIQPPAPALVAPVSLVPLPGLIPGQNFSRLLEISFQPDSFHSRESPGSPLSTV